jgi:outer membrane murein-binding lipoprotein Lpp
LKDECDIGRIIKYFKESKSYLINTYTDSQVAENPDLVDYIIFTYKNGTTEIINLELTEEEKSNIASSVIQELKVAKSEADREAARANQTAAEESWRQSHPMHDPSEQQTSDLYSDEYYDTFKIKEEQSRWE